MNKIYKSKFTKENWYKFLTDRTNKLLVINFLSIVSLFLCVLFISNFVMKLLVYYILYLIIVKYYDKVINVLFKKVRSTEGA